MRILLVHNRYRHVGGEDAVFEAERDLLKNRGHSVMVYERHNDEIDENGIWKRADLLRRTVWATDSGKDITRIVADGRPEVAHFYNTFPLVSPSAYYACSRAGVPVVQTLANYRLVCPGANLERNGRTCELCLEKNLPWPAIRFACYRSSRVQSTAVAAMLAIHNMAGTWRNHVDTYIALTNFARRKLIEGGLPADKIVVKPNFLNHDPKVCDGDRQFALYVGRLSKEKGVDTLLRAWEELPSIPLAIAGDGPLMAAVRSTVRQSNQASIQILGWRPADEIAELMSRARFLVFPSYAYEGFPLTVLEALAHGTPVIGSDLGSTGEIVRDGISGLLFEPGNPADLAATVRRLWDDEPLCRKLGHGARSQFTSHYTADRNHELMMRIFRDTIERKRSRPHAP